MHNVTVEFKKLFKDTQLPTQAYPGDAGLDLYVHRIESRLGGKLRANIGKYAGDRILVKCGFAMALPEGWEAQIRPRSGLALKKGLTVLNSPGTIDAGYRNEICVILLATAPWIELPEKGERIAQMVIKPVPKVLVKVVDELEGSERGQNGFGSSGKS